MNPFLGYGNAGVLGGLSGPAGAGAGGLLGGGMDENLRRQLLFQALAAFGSGLLSNPLQPSTALGQGFSGAQQAIAYGREADERRRAQEFQQREVTRRAGIDEREEHRRAEMFPLDKLGAEAQIEASRATTERARRPEEPEEPKYQLVEDAQGNYVWISPTGEPVSSGVQGRPPQGQQPPSQQLVFDGQGNPLTFNPKTGALTAAQAPPGTSFGEKRQDDPLLAQARMLVVEESKTKFGLGDEVPEAWMRERLEYWYEILREMSGQKDILDDLF